MPNEVKSLNDECGVFGVWGVEGPAAKVAYSGLHALQHRGQEGAGILAIDANKRLNRYRGQGLLGAIFDDPHAFDRLHGNAALGHIRYATAGSHTINNVQPFMFENTETHFALSHNGNLTNADTLKEMLRKTGTIFQSDSDSEIFGDLIEISNQDTFLGRIKEAANQMHGGFAYVLLSPDAMYAVCDPNGLRPLVVGKRKDGAVVICSETCALDQVQAEYVRDVQPGEVVIVDDSGIKIDHFTEDTELTICSMEYVYFARPDSVIHGVSVHEARKRMGALVARENPTKADVVIGVPNSSLSAAMGYAIESGIPYEMGLIKNQYVARTFIEPTQERRERGVSMKLSVVKSVIKDKDVILVDDSIVRGTTSRFIVKMLKNAGAKSVHVRIASPDLKYPCFYGIDIQKPSELIGANHSIEEIKDIIEADSLKYLSVEGLIEAIDLDCDNQYHGLCTAYFDGKYPTPLYDYQETYDAEAKRLHLYEEDEVNG
ncbi:amidophosphoribosyltransferase [Apilactobacillus kunkeei]|uniref:Amidophosphoribosyltransferase n=1 Tax=Apilactobacillus nanyangensis TaxID=2799579 RepID=A0ABT0HVG5_9LACO|nr:amidophosphoribosyltransferase [Apilactobacillus nanyangensis]MCK8610915.1 amidophosphoribosyltransferase [Apilactobacillus nanyangensis]TMS99764.1 amidophosphoribosyltransferase [Apilactobacillus kunkeei]TMT03116.1 amidophosphoribosyltransferase [Apilactobacillus kunkeei]